MPISPAIDLPSYTGSVSMPSVRHVLLSGESMPADLLRELMQLCPNARLGTAWSGWDALPR